MSPERAEPAPLAVPAVSALCVGVLTVYALASGPRAYGAMSDEYYYLECASRLAWGYVDHPPFAMAVLAAVKSLLGTSLLALRLVPALLACLNVVWVAMLTRELGGGRNAQSLAALGVAAAPVYLALVGFYSMNSFEPPLWTGAGLLLARIANGGDRRLWLVLGVLLGVGLLTKISTLWLGAGLAVGLVLTAQRRWLATPWPWACAAIAAALFAPHLVWQAQHDWPTLEFMRNAREQKMLPRSPLEILTEMLLLNWVATLPLWLAGLAAFFRSERLRPHRWLAWIWLTVMALLATSGTTRANYGAPAFAFLLAGGGVAVEGVARPALRGVVSVALAVWTLVIGLGALPMAVPLLPPAELARYMDTLGIHPSGGEKEGSGLLPLHLALRFGWDELAEAVAGAAATLAPGERLEAFVWAPSFGEAGALNASPRDLPRAVSGHNNYWLWGPGEVSGEVAIVVAPDPEGAERFYRSVVLAAEVDCRFCRPAMDRHRVWVARGLKVPLDEFWTRIKHYE